MKSFKGSAAGPMVCYSVTVNIDPPNLAANLGAYLDVPIPAAPGCVLGQRVFINPLADISVLGYTLSDARVKETNVARIQCVNATAGGANPDALDCAFVFLGEKGSV